MFSADSLTSQGSPLRGLTSFLVPTTPVPYWLSEGLLLLGPLVKPDPPWVLFTALLAPWQAQQHPPRLYAAISLRLANKVFFPLAHLSLSYSLQAELTSSGQGHSLRYTHPPLERPYLDLEVSNGLRLSGHDP